MSAIGIATSEDIAEHGIFWVVVFWQTRLLGMVMARVRIGTGHRLLGRCRRNFCSAASGSLIISQAARSEPHHGQKCEQ